jgi:hypothetical protein
MHLQGRSSRTRVTAIVAALLLTVGAVLAKPKPKPAGQVAAQQMADVDLPADANEASLRVSALDTIYEMDLSAQQLNAVRAAATATADLTKRTPGHTTPPFLAVLRSFQNALLDGKDDQEIARLRNQVLELANGGDIQLDNDIVTTAPARARSADLCLKIKASQIAAYLAAHADEVSDPQELIMSTADGVQDVRDDSAEKATAEETIGAMIQDTATTVGELVAGMDEVRAHAVAEQATNLLRSVDKGPAADFAKRRADLEDSSAKIVGNTTPMQVLNNWLDRQLAILLSNPQLPEAIDAILKVRLQ